MQLGVDVVRVIEGENIQVIIAVLEKLKRNYGDKDKEQNISKTVRNIIDDVKYDDDKALLKYTNRFDKTDFKSTNELKITAEEIEEAYKSCSPESIKALETARNRIKSYHEKQLPDDLSYIDDTGMKLGWKWTPIDSVGLYVPGGLAAYPSSVLMNAIPATVAGVTKMVMVSPTPYGKTNALVLAAAKIAGITEIYKVGGAQAIAALAYGTETIPAVAKIVGPGNAYVAEAKRQVFGRVGIDMIAGPSEILIISDKNSNQKWIAADLLSQAEHDRDARSILVTDNREFAHSVINEVENTLKTLSKEDIARKSWGLRGIVVIVNNLDEAVEISNIIAPEHLELAVDNPEELEPKIRNAGAIFMGRYTPEAIGDYIAGPSHVLPTSGSARFSSGLSVFDFLKRSSIISCDKESFNKISGDAELLANEEGLTAHALSISIRRE